MEPTDWIESYEMAMEILEVSDAVCARYLSMMLDGPAKSWLKNLPVNSINSWQELKDQFIKKFQGTCKRPTTITDLENCVQKEGESAQHWSRRVAEIIHTSVGLTAQQAVIALERNCKFDPLRHKLGRIKRYVTDMSELMDAMTKYAESDKTKDVESDDEKSGKGKKNAAKAVQNPSQTNGNQQSQNNNKRKNGEGNSDFVANTNTGYKNQRPNSGYRGNNRNFRPNSFAQAQQALKGPCPQHSKNGRIANHSWENCFIMDEIKNNRGNGQGPGNNGQGNRGESHAGTGNPGHPNNTSHHGTNHQRMNQEESHQGGVSGFQNNPKQLSQGQYHVFTTSSCRRDRKLQRRAVNAVAPAVPRWLNWSE